jgi:hypothetical protein
LQFIAVFVSGCLLLFFFAFTECFNHNYWRFRCN